MKKGLWAIGVFALAAIFRFTASSAQTSDNFYDSLLDARSRTHYGRL